MQERRDGGTSGATVKINATVAFHRSIGQLTSMALRDWYADRELLLTGATSDVGRALLEKILRSFPRVKVYAIVRSRHGFTKDDRIKNIFLSPR